MSMRVVPRRYRFATALSLARVTVPLFRASAAYREQWIKNFHRPDEIVLYLLLNALAKNGTRFDLEIATTGYQHFERGFAKGKGVLVTGHHAALTLLMIRFFHDQGLAPVVITPDRFSRREYSWCNCAINSEPASSSAPCLTGPNITPAGRSNSRRPPGR
jgi:hypothetical protein